MHSGFLPDAGQGRWPSRCTAQAHRRIQGYARKEGGVPINSLVTSAVRRHMATDRLQLAVPWLEDAGPWQSCGI